MGWTPWRPRPRWPAAIRWPRPRRCAPAASRPALAAAALTQTELRRRAAAKFGAGRGPDVLHPRRAGAGDPRGRRGPAGGAAAPPPGVRTLADLGCGLGSDALAAARAGHPGVRGGRRPADRRAGRRERRRGRAGRPGDASSARTRRRVPVEQFDAVFADPARRRAGRRPGVRPAGRTRRRGTSWPALAGRVPRTVLKLAPGIDHALLPPGAEGEWVSVDGDLVEAAFWCGPLAARATPGDPAARADAAQLDRQRGGRGGAGRAGRRVTSTTRTRPWSASHLVGRVRRGDRRPARRPGHRLRLHRRAGRHPVRAGGWRSPTCCRSRSSGCGPCCASAASAGWRSASGAPRWSPSSCAATCGWPARTRPRWC